MKQVRLKKSYGRSRCTKDRWPAEQIAATTNLLCRDFADPHGTHKVCFDVVIEALKAIKKSKAKWIDNCWLWLYKGAIWQEWDITEIEMAIPMSPDQVMKKNATVFSFINLKKTVYLPGKRWREFWQRAEERNANTAKLYAPAWPYPICCYGSL